MAREVLTDGLTVPGNGEGRADIAHGQPREGQTDWHNGRIYKTIWSGRTVPSVL